MIQTVTAENNPVVQKYSEDGRKADRHFIFVSKWCDAFDSDIIDRKGGVENLI